MCRPYGTLTLLSALMREVYKDLMENQTDEETWSWVARDILLDTWTALLQVPAIFFIAALVCALLYLITTYVYDLLSYCAESSFRVWLSVTSFICYLFARKLYYWATIRPGKLLFD